MKFNQAISRYKRTWVIGNYLKALLVLICICIATLIIYGLADAIWAMSNDTRSLLNKILITTAIIASIWVIVKALKTPQADIAAIADSSSDNSAKNIRAAYDLSQQKSTSPLQAYLSEEAQEHATKDIASIPLKSKIPFKSIGLTALGVITAIAVGFGIRAIHPAAYDTVTQRLMHPDKDIPPYSPLSFQVSQDSPNTLYGGENQVRVEITGGEIKQDVICRVRDKQTGKIETLRTYQETPKTFSKKFTNVLSDFEFSFATGNATSIWHDVSVILQPKFTTATIKVTPPSYTKKPVQESPLEGNEIRVINGSEISLTITSNRPLSGGELQLTSETELQKDSIKATKNKGKDNQVSFSWTASNSASISCRIKDVRNTESANQLEFDIITRADLAPVADLISPARQVLATPSSSIPLKGIVEDDYEIDSVHLVRTLVGFRDRATQLTSNISKVQYDFSQKLDLSELGVEPKQTLEFYLEANDKNPNLLGVGLSDVVRVSIISDEEYATRIRNATKLREFNIRFKVLTKAIKEAIDSLHTLKEQNLKQDRDPFEEKQVEAIETHVNSYKLALQISQDFEAYEIEAQLTETAAEVAEKLITNHSQLSELNFDNGIDSNEQFIDEMLTRLGGALEKAEKVERDANMVAKFGAVADQAATYRQLIAQQESISNRIINIAKELRMGVTRNAQTLKVFGNTQKKNKEQLLKFAKDLKKAADGLPIEYESLKSDTEFWLEQLEELNIPDPMDTTTLATEVGKSHEAAEQAFLALSLMKQLQSMEDNEFASLLRKELPESMKDDDLAETLKQLLAGLCNAKEKGNGGKPGGQGGQGDGAGGQGGGGLMRNSNIPMFGPGRSKFANPGGSGFGNGSGGAKKGNGNQAKVSESNTLKQQDKRTDQTSQATRTNIPSKYKDAVKRFYTDNDTDKPVSE